MNELETLNKHLQSASSGQKLVLFFALLHDFAAQHGLNKPIDLNQLLGIKSDKPLVMLLSNEVIAKP